MYDADLDGTIPPDLEIANYGFVDADMDKEVKLGNLLQSGFLANDRGPVRLRDIVKRLRQAKTRKPDADLARDVAKRSMHDRSIAAPLGWSTCTYGTTSRHMLVASSPDRQTAAISRAYACQVNWIREQIETPQVLIRSVPQADSSH